MKVEGTAGDCYKDEMSVGMEALEVAQSQGSGYLWNRKRSSVSLKEGEKVPVS